MKYLLMFSIPVVSLTLTARSPANLSPELQGAEIPAVPGSSQLTASSAQASGSSLPQPGQKRLRCWWIAY